jgi:hypothetical protein
VLGHFDQDRNAGAACCWPEGPGGVEGQAVSPEVRVASFSQRRGHLRDHAVAGVVMPVEPPFALEGSLPGDRVAQGGVGEDHLYRVRLPGQGGAAVYVRPADPLQQQFLGRVKPLALLAKRVA